MFSLSRVPWLRRWFGDRSERAAEQFLTERGFRILQRNYRCPPGEIDLIALDGDTLVFVEVRSTGAGHGERTSHSVDAAKQRKLTQAALHFRERFRLYHQNYRFDVIVVEWRDGSAGPDVQHFRAAFEAVGRFQLDY